MVSFPSPIQIHHISEFSHIRDFGVYPVLGFQRQLFLDIVSRNTITALDMLYFYILSFYTGLAAYTAQPHRLPDISILPTAVHPPMHSLYH
jgi:hypothetical protein